MTQVGGWVIGSSILNFDKKVVFWGPFIAISNHHMIGISIRHMTLKMVNMKTSCPCDQRKSYIEYTEVETGPPQTSKTESFATFRSGCFRFTSVEKKNLRFF